MCCGDRLNSPLKADFYRFAISFYSSPLALPIASHSIRCGMIATLSTSDAPRHFQLSSDRLQALPDKLFMGLHLMQHGLECTDDCLSLRQPPLIRLYNCYRSFVRFRFLS